MSLSLHKPILLLGAGSFAVAVAESLLAAGFDLVGFVDSYSRKQSECGLPVMSWPEACNLKDRQGIQLACAVFNREYPFSEIVEMAALHGFSQVLMPWDYYPRLAERLGWRYWLAPDQVDPFLIDPEATQSVSMLLNDDESREILRRTLAFRRGGDLAFSSYRSKEDQYFNDISLQSMPGRRISTYVDVGAFNGDTLKRLLETGSVDRAILFEPDRDNLEKLKQGCHEILCSYPRLDLQIMPLAASDQNAFCQASGAGESVSLHLAGSVQESQRAVHLVRLDDLYPSMIVDFVKIDAEGHDRECLQGMAQLIRRSQPVIAVSVYHRHDDIDVIPRLIRDILVDCAYNFYLRQHMYNSFDCVLYAVPVR